jgi:hypothetical protein
LFLPVRMGASSERFHCRFFPFLSVSVILPQIQLGILGCGPGCHLVFPNFRRALRRYTVMPAAQYNFFYNQSEDIADASFHGYWISLLKITGAKGRCSHVIKIRYRRTDRSSREDLSVRPPLMCGEWPPFAVRCYVLLSRLHSRLELYCY